MSLHYIANNLSEAQLSSPSAYASAFLAGVASHQLFFRFGEWDLYAAQLIFGFIVANVGGAVALIRYCPEIELAAAVKVVPPLSSIAVGGIFSSILVYRAFFHRLNKFPGPFLARLSNFYITWRSVSRFQLFKDVQELHRQYGDIVRIGMLQNTIPLYWDEQANNAGQAHLKSQLQALRLLRKSTRTNLRASKGLGIMFFIQSYRCKWSRTTRSMPGVGEHGTWALVLKVILTL